MIQRYKAVTWQREASLRHARLLALLAFSSALGACSFDLPSLAPDPVETTGSIKAVADPTPLSSALDAEDWRRAKAAMAVALDPQGAGTAVNWDNPDSRRRGTFTAAGKPYVEENEICRAFDARIVLTDKTIEMDGKACRQVADDWEIRGVTPARRG